MCFLWRLGSVVLVGIGGLSLMRKKVEKRGKERFGWWMMERVFGWGLMEKCSRGGGGIDFSVG